MSGERRFGDDLVRTRIDDRREIGDRKDIHHQIVMPDEFAIAD